jgi:hypothetical protein
MVMDSDAGALELMAAGRALGLRGCVSSMSRRPKKAEKTEEELTALEAKIDAVFDRCGGEEEKEIRVKPATLATPTIPATPPTPTSLVSLTSTNASVAASPSPEKTATGTPSPARRKSGIPKPRPSGLKAPQQRRASKGKPSPGS